MRLWSVHPRYLDPQGLVALWREGLLAQAVLAGKTRGYHHHPQLVRFRDEARPLDVIAAYLHVVADEATRRGYSFDTTKLPQRPKVNTLTVSVGQLRYELQHLEEKLRVRNPEYHATLPAEPEAHPLFDVVDGEVAEWERVRTASAPRSRARAGAGR